MRYFVEMLKGKSILCWCWPDDDRDEKGLNKDEPFSDLFGKHLADVRTVLERCPGREYGNMVVIWYDSRRKVFSFGRMQDGLSIQYAVSIQTIPERTGLAVDSAWFLEMKDRLSGKPYV